ncbi:ester cyclase, partial [Alkalihalobacillus clausii]|uniref:ester cyclase n=1 Tax=Shouchella clausii TaxID=79880 RepID=UPI001C0D81D2
WFTQVLRPAFPDLVVTIHDQVAEADTVVTRKSYAGTHSAEFFGVPATGKRVDFPMIDIIRLVDAQYVEHWSTVDLFGMMRQLNS